MATFALKDAKLYIGAYDMSGNHNRIILGHDQAALDDTVFGDSFRSRTSGLQSVRLEASGYFSAGSGEPDDVYAAEFSQGATIFSVFPQGGAAGEAGYTGLLLHTERELGGSVEELAGFTIRGDGTVLVPGWALHTGPVTATGTSTPLNLGAVPAGKSLYAVLHVLSASGTDPTLDVVVQSDDAEAFSSPADQITFAQVSDLASEWATPVPGPITDTWYRVSYTVGGTDDPSFDFLVALGIR